MKIDIETLFNLVSTLTLVLGAFYKIKNNLNSHYIFIKNNSKLIEQIDNDIKKIKDKIYEEIETIKDTHIDYIANEKQTMVDGHHKLENDLLKEINNINKLMNDLREEIVKDYTGKIDKINEIVIKKLDIINEKITVLKDLINANESNITSIKTEIEAIDRHEIDYLKKDLERLEKSIDKHENTYHK